MCANQKITSFKDLYAWQEAAKIVNRIYRITSTFPDTERFGLTSQMRRATVSVTSNIAESFSRRGKKDKIQLLAIALGSLTELQSQIYICHDINQITKPEYDLLDQGIITTHKLINGLIRTLKA